MYDCYHTYLPKFGCICMTKSYIYTSYRQAQHDTIMLDIENPNESVKEIKEKFLRLHNRFIAVAMDYKYYINGNFSDDEIYKLRNNVIFRLQSARFHFELLLQHHHYIEHNIKEIHSSQHPVLNGGPELQMYQIQATEEIYSLFDSLVYHLCSNFDYLFRLINFIHGKTNLSQPKWNLYKTEKNLKQNIYCSKELIEALEILDQKFVYPLIKHRSFLIHNEYAIGGLRMVLNDFKTRFLATKTLKEDFPELEKEFGEKDMSINFAAKWLIEKTFETITEVLFEIRDDMIRNKKPNTEPIFFIIGQDNKPQSTSVYYWGNRNEI